MTNFKMSQSKFSIIILDSKIWNIKLKITNAKMHGQRFENGYGI